MRKFFWLSLVCCSFLAAWTGPAAFADPSASPVASAAEDSITVRLISGRTFTAALDRRTDAGQLWLRFEEAGIELLRPIDWDRIVSVTAAGQKLTGREFRQLVEKVRKEIPPQPSLHDAKADIVMIGSTETEQPPLVNRATEIAATADTRRVVSLAIDARTVNWDENVEADGLLVHVYPLDADGAVVPVHGTLNVDLKAEQNGVNRQSQPFVEAGRWSEKVRPADFNAGGALYKLRFQSIHPEFDRSIGSLGAVHACLTIPGQGTFEATADTVSLRSSSAVRHRLQMSTGRRFFSDERTGG